MATTEAREPNCNAEAQQEPEVNKQDSPNLTFGIEEHPPWHITLAFSMQVGACNKY